MANVPMKDIQFPGLDDTYTFAQIDNTLTQTGQAADAKKTGDEITALKADITDKADKSEALGSYVTETASGAIASFPDGADGVPVKDLVAQIVPVQAGSGDPAPDNIREIVGWTGTGVHRTGVNLLGGELLVNNTKLYMPSATVYEENKYVSFSGQASISADSPNGLLDFFHAKENTAYTFIITYAKSSSYGSNMRIVYTDGTTEAIPRLTNESAKETKVVVTNPNKTVKALEKANSGGYTRLYYDECGVFEGVLTAKDFVPYEGQTVDIDWTDEAGTVYGGTLGVTNGVLTVTYGNIASYNGETLPGEWISDRDVYVAGTSPTTGAQVVYELAEPLTYQLTPAEVTTLLGHNSIWCDCNYEGSLSVGYRADTKLYIEKLTAPTEDDMTANVNIPDATYFMIGNTLYLSTTTIPAGDTINPGTNCTLMSLASALNALNS